MLSQEKILEMIKPGQHPNPDAPVNECKPCGKCDGVVFLLEGLEGVEKADGTPDVSYVPSLEKQALSYLRPMPALWRALNRKLGVTSPRGIEVMFPREIWDVQKASGRGIGYLFAHDDWCVHAAHQRYRLPVMRWAIINVEPGIWVFLFDKEGYDTREAQRPKPRPANFKPRMFFADGTSQPIDVQPATAEK